MNFRKIAALLAALMIIFSFTACGKTVTEEKSAPAAETTAAVQPADLQEAAVTKIVSVAPTKPEPKPEPKPEENTAPAEKTEPESAAQPLDEVPEGLTRVDTGFGFSICLPDTLLPDELGGVLMYHTDGTVNMTVKQELFTKLEGYTEGMTAEDYASLINQRNGGGYSFSPDEYGNLRCVYDRSEFGYTYYTAVVLGSDAGYMISFSCPGGAADSYLPQFGLWTSTAHAD